MRIETPEEYAQARRWTQVEIEATARKGVAGGDVEALASTDVTPAELLAWCREQDTLVFRIPFHVWARWGRTQRASDARDVGRCLAEADHDEGNLIYDEGALRDWLAEYGPSDAELADVFAGYRETVDRYSAE